jgi:excisionase family DNA binding protein
MDRWMTLQEVAKYLRVSKDSIYRLAQKGEIPASKLGNLWRFKKEEIDEWMRKKRNSQNITK